MNDLIFIKLFSLIFVNSDQVSQPKLNGNYRSTHQTLIDNCHESQNASASVNWIQKKIQHISNFYENSLPIEGNKIKMDVINQQIKEEMQILNELKNELRRLPEPDKTQGFTGQIYSTRNASADEIHLHSKYFNSNERLITPSKISEKELESKEGRNIWICSLEDDKVISTVNTAKNHDEVNITDKFWIMNNSRNRYKQNSSAASSKNSEHSSDAHNFLKKRSNLKYDPMESMKQAKQRK